MGAQFFPGLDGFLIKKKKSKIKSELSRPLNSNMFIKPTNKSLWEEMPTLIKISIKENSGKNDFPLGKTMRKRTPA